MYTNRLQPLPMAASVLLKQKIRETEFKFSVVDNVIRLDCKERPCAQSTVCRNSFTRGSTPVEGQRSNQEFLSIARDPLKAKKLRANSALQGEIIPHSPWET